MKNLDEKNSIASNTKGELMVGQYAELAYFQLPAAIILITCVS